jgi:hypothetical protein
MVSVNVGAGDLVKSCRNGLVAENGMQEEQFGHALEVLSNRNIENILSREARSTTVLQSLPNPVKQDEREVNKDQDSINPNNRCGDDDACHLQPAQMLP